jgi:parallel beta-helix repeat protein
VKKRIFAGLLALVLGLSLGLVIAPIGETVQADPAVSTIEVSQPTYLTSNANKYDRNPSIIHDGTNYWLFYTKADSTVGVRGQDGYNPDADAYVIYYKTASTIAGLADVAETKLAISDASPAGSRPSGFTQREVSAVYFNSSIYVFTNGGQSGTDRGLYYYKYSSDSWAGPTKLTLEAATWAGHADAVVDGDHIAIVWDTNPGTDFYTFDGTNNDISASKKDIDSASSQPKITKMGSTLYVVNIQDTSPNPIHVWKSIDGGNNWTDGGQVTSVSGYWDPCIFNDGTNLYVVSAPSVGTIWGDQQYLAVSCSADSGATWSPVKKISSGGYGSAVWWDYWPIGFHDTTGNYLFFATETDGYTFSDSEIAYIKMDWNLDNDHYFTIQSAVTAASAGDTINVAAGTYTEQVVITRSLTLQGAGAANTTIQAPATLTATTWTHRGTAFNTLIEVNGATVHGITVNISGFTIDGLNKSSASPRYTGIVYYNANGTISANTITKFGSAPVAGEDGWGVFVVEGCNVAISGNTIDNWSKGGIVVDGDDDIPNTDVTATITGNTITGAGDIAASAQNGIQISRGATGTVNSNNIISNIGFTPTTYSAAGILVYMADGVTVSGNTTNNTETGVYVQDQNTSGGISGNVVSDNNITGSKYGVYVLRSSNTEISGNTIDGSTYFGVRVGSDSATTTIENNAIKNSVYDGIHIESSAATITGVVITGNDILNNNTADNTTSGGIFVGQSGSGSVDASEVTVHENNISGNKQYGVLNYNATGTLDATNNWWGSANGPAHASNTFNVGEQGDKVSNNVLFTPWLNSGVDSDTTIPGFQPAAGTSFAPVTIGDDGYSSIQSAITAAAEGATINVAAGTYDEQVVINKSLTLQGAGDTTIIKPSQATASSFQLFSRASGGTNNTAPVIVATDTSSVTIKKLKVDGSLVTSVPSGANNFIGILYRGVGGVIDTVTVTGIGVTEKGSSILLSSMGNTVNVEVKGCNISNFLKGGITADYAGLTANIHDNIVTGSGPSSASCPNAIEIAYGATGTVTNNQVSNVAYTGTGYWWAYGIIFGDASGTATGNTLTNCQAGIGAEAPYASSHTVTISNNTISAAGLTGVPNVFGIYVCTGDDNAAIDVTIMNNDLSAGGPGKGIQIGDTSANGAAGTVNATIEGNDISNWRDGIWLDSTTNQVTITDNVITNNIAVGSGIHIATAVNAANILVEDNSIEGNEGYGIYNGGTGTLNAENNWWGDKNGPTTDAVMEIGRAHV